MEIMFRYNGKILEYGYPANDIFYIDEKYESKRNEVRQKLNISNIFVMKLQKILKLKIILIP